MNAPSGRRSSESPRRCPGCGAAGAIDSGPIMHPAPTLVAGVPIDLTGIRFRLARCPVCGMCFKDPPVPEDRLLACYSTSKSDHWESDPDPEQRCFDVIAKVLERHAPGRRLLDIGCFNGALLGYLGDRWERFGIEPSLDGAAMARGRGIDVVAGRIEDVPETDTFDAIMAIDVIEHLTNPLEWFQAVARHLRPGGIFLAQTGDTDSPGWRLQGSTHWYCSLVEHVTFYNKRSMTELARRAGMRSIAHVRTYHQRSRLVVRASQAFKNAAYVAGRSVGGFGLPPLRHLFMERRAPIWIAAKDHMIHVMERIGPANE